MPHTFYCSTIECQKEVKKGGDTCDTCKGAMSYESSECPGCGEHILCGANGYCAGCWMERFGDDESTISHYDHECTNVFDHEIGQWTCGQADKHKCSGPWDYDLGIRVCDNNDDPDCPQHKCTANFDLESEKYPPLPPSPIATADDEIDAIEEKLRTASLMTENQKADWEFLWHDAKRRRRQEGCDRNVRTRVE